MNVGKMREKKFKYTIFGWAGTNVTDSLAHPTLKRLLPATARTLVAREIGVFWQTNTDDT